MLVGLPESRSTAIIRRTAELFASEAPLVDLFPRFAGELATLFAASAVNLALGTAPSNLLLYKDGAVTSSPADVTRIAVALAGQISASSRAIAVPLLYNGEVVGALGVRAADGTEYEDDDVDALRACGLYLAVRVNEQQIRSERDRLALLAGTDALTGLPNRRAFDERLEAEWRRAVREEASLGVVMIDVDLFKSFNDRYGHIAGDLCLKRVAAGLADALRRPGDVIARVGGEEFCAILPATDLVGAVTLADAMRACVAAQAIPHEGNPKGIVTVSCGVAAARPLRDHNALRLVAAADDALYVAKAAGRDHVATGAIKER